MNKNEKGQVTKNAAEIYEEFFLPALFQECADKITSALKIVPDNKILDVDMRENDQATPLHYAAESGKIHAVGMLLSKRADVHAKGKDGKMALDYAVEKGHVHVVAFLLKKGAKVTPLTRELFEQLQSDKKELIGENLGIV